MNQSVYDATIAAITGLTLGSPHVGRNTFLRLTGYSPIPHRMNAHASLDSWLIWQKAATEGKNPESLGQLLLDGLDDHVDETAYGLMNLRRGFGAPLSGRLDNPLSTGSRGLLRSVIWAFLTPEHAGKFAYFDASIDHSSDGAVLPAALAHAVSITSPGSTPGQLWEAFSRVLPADSLMHKVGPYLIENQGHPEATQIFASQFTSRFPGVDRLGIVASTSFVLVGLLNSGMDAERAMLLTAGCGGQTDLTTGTSAAIGAYLWGSCPSDYLGALDGAYIGTHALRQISPPATIKEFATLIATASSEPIPAPAEVEVAVERTPEPPATIDSHTAPDSTEPAESVKSESPEVTPSEEAEPVITEPEPEPDPYALRIIAATRQTIELFKREPNFAALEVAGTQVTVHYLDDPVGALPVKKINLALTNLTDQTQNLQLALTGPEGWQVASRVADTAIPPKSETSFPAVIQPPADPSSDNNLRLHLNKLRVLIPFAPAQRFWLLGPFTNIEGNGFTQVHPPEKCGQLIQSMGQAFSGRSELGIRWTEQFYSGAKINLEPVFNQGPGAAFLYGHVSWPAGVYRIRAAFPGGLKVWIDGQNLISFNDKSPKPPNHSSYEAQFSTPGESRILIKIVRDRDPIPNLFLTFFDEQGHIIYPETFVKDV